MHELGIVYEVIKIVDEFAVANDLTRADKIILEIGQLSQILSKPVIRQQSVTHPIMRPSWKSSLCRPWGSVRLAMNILMWSITVRYAPAVRRKHSV